MASRCRHAASIKRGRDRRPFVGTSLLRAPLQVKVVAYKNDARGASETSSSSSDMYLPCLFLVLLVPSFLFYISFDTFVANTYDTVTTKAYNAVIAMTDFSMHDRSSEGDPEATFHAQEDQRHQDLAQARREVEGTPFSSNPISSTTESRFAQGAAQQGLLQQVQVAYAPTTEKPPKYSGTRDNDAAKYWLIRADYCVDQQEIQRNRAFGAREYIVFVTTFLSGAAMTWWISTLGSSADSSVLEWHRFPTRASFKDPFLKFFGDIRTQETRRDLFDRYIQVKDVATFWADLQGMVLNLNPRPLDADTKRVFKRGLKTEVRNRIEILPDASLPEDLQQYVAYAIKCEQEIRANGRKPIPAGRSNGGAGGGFGVRNARIEPSTPASVGPFTDRRGHSIDGDGDVIMGMNGLRSRGGSNSSNRRGRGFVSSLSSSNRGTSSPASGPNQVPLNAIRSERRDSNTISNNLCFGCGSPDHRIAQCPAPRDPPSYQAQNRGSRGSSRGSRRGQGCSGNAHRS